MKEQFIEESLLNFLKSEGVLKYFIRNIVNDTSKGEDFYSENYLCTDISAAFIWRLTPEGKDFWEGFDNRFKGIL